MKKLLMMLLMLPLWAWAQSPLDGTWKFNLDSAKFPTKPDVVVYQNGMYECKSCLPPHSIKADGQWHKIMGDPYMDELMVKVVDGKHSEQATRKSGKETGTVKISVSDDGKTKTIDWVDSSSPNGKEVSGKSVETLITPGPAGSLPLSGSWRMEKVSDMSSEALLFTYKSTPDGMDWTSSTGQSYSAKFDGAFVPIKGDPANTTVAIKKLGPNSLQETNKRGGKIVGVGTVTVDGNKMNMQYNDKEQGTSMKIVAEKQ